MRLRFSETLLKLEESARTLVSQFGTAKSTVIEESAALGSRLDRIERKLDEVLDELRGSRRNGR